MSSLHNGHLCTDACCYSVLVRHTQSPSLYGLQARRSRNDACHAPLPPSRQYKNWNDTSLLCWCVYPALDVNFPLPTNAPLGFYSRLPQCIALLDIDTNIVPVSIKLLLAGIPKAPVPRIAGAILHAASNPSVESNGSAWLLTDNGPVFQVPKEQFKEGVYEMIDARANRLLKYAYFTFTLLLHLVRTHTCL